MKRLGSASQVVAAIGLSLVVLCAGCTTGGAHSHSPATPETPASQSPTSSTSLPDWLRIRIGQYEALPIDRAPLGIWRITRNGQPAYYVQSPCCDQFNPFYDAAGTEICSPSGGFTGRGDGKCPTPMDPGTDARKVWSHPSAPDNGDDPPGIPHG